MAEQEVLNVIQQAGKEALKFAEAHDAARDFGGKLAHEEIEKDEARADAPTPDDPAPTEESTSLEAPKAPTADDPWSLLAEGAGKWKDAEEAKKGYFHALNLAKNALAERDALRAERGQPSQAQRTEPVTREEERNALKRIEEFGVPSEVLAEAIDERAQEVLMKILQPMANQYQADQYMAEKYGDAWTKNKPEVDLYVQSDAGVNALVNAARAKGEVALANEFAFLRYQADRGVKTEEALKANNEVRKELVETARKDAGIVGSRRSEGRDKDSKPEGLTKERFDSLVARAKAGYDRPLWRETIGKGLPKEYFE